MTREELWKNFNLGTELQVSGGFIYNGLYIFDEMESFHHEEEVFEFLYNIAVGLERLMKIVIILSTHDQKEVDQVSFEEKIKTHKHTKLMEMARKHHNLNLDKPHFALLELLDNFYKNMRYDRFSLENVRNYDKEKKAFEFFLAEYLDVIIYREDMLFARNINTRNIKKRMGKLIGKISTQLYDAVWKESHRLNIYTYEVRYNSKAYKIFLRKEFDFTNENNYWKEMLIFLMHDSTQHELKEVIQNTEPLDFDTGMIPEYIKHFKSHLKKLESIDEMEALYDDLDDEGKARQGILEYIDSEPYAMNFEKDVDKNEFESIINFEESKLRGEYISFDEQTCDLCRKIMIRDKYLIDGATKPRGTWAWMCGDCFRENGIGIKWGIGQLYQRIGNKWLLVAGYDNVGDSLE